MLGHGMVVFSPSIHILQTNQEVSEWLKKEEYNTCKYQTGRKLLGARTCRKHMDGFRLLVACSKARHHLDDANLYEPRLIVLERVVSGSFSAFGNPTRRL